MRQTRITVNGDLYGEIAYNEIQPNGYLDHAQGVIDALAADVGTKVTAIDTLKEDGDGGYRLSMEVENVPCERPRTFIAVAHIPAANLG